MKKKLLALLLALAMLTALLAGCGSSAAPADASAAAPASDEAAPAQEEAPAEAPAPAEEAAPAEAPASAEEPSAEETEAEASPEEIVYDNMADKYLAESIKTNEDFLDTISGVNSDISYPLSDGSEHISIYHVFSAFIWGELASSYADFAIMPDVEAATGISLDFVEVSDSAASEQFNLLIASGDMPDMMSMDRYTGSTTGAFDDDIIYDLTDLVDEHMPYYSTIMKTADDYTARSLYADDGSILAVYVLASNVVQEQGLSYRADWAEEVGMETPTTVDELYDYLTAVNELHPCTYPLFIDGSAVLEGFTPAFGTPGVTLSYTDLGMKVNNGKIVATIADDSFRSYIEAFNKFYSAGLIKDDFYSESYGPDYINSYIIDDSCAVSTIRSDKFDTLHKSAASETFSFQALAPLTTAEHPVYQFNTKKRLIGMGNYSITTSCEDPELVCEFMDWFYTEDGYWLGNYGQEGVAFEYDADGVPYYTDLILNNPNGYNTMSIRNFYTNPLFPFYQNAVSLFYSYGDSELTAFDVWNNNGTDECTIPTMSLTTDETADYANIASTVYTYASEQILKWMIGEESLTDESWSAYVKQCQDMGLADAEEIYQTVYDRMYT